MGFAQEKCSQPLREGKKDFVARHLVVIFVLGTVVVGCIALAAFYIRASYQKAIIYLCSDGPPIHGNSNQVLVTKGFLQILRAAYNWYARGRSVVIMNSVIGLDLVLILA